VPLRLQAQTCYVFLQLFCMHLRPVTIVIDSKSLCAVRAKDPGMGSGVGGNLCCDISVCNGRRCSMPADICSLTEGVQRTLTWKLRRLAGRAQHVMPTLLPTHSTARCVRWGNAFRAAVPIMSCSVRFVTCGACIDSTGGHTAVLASQRCGLLVGSVWRVDAPRSPKTAASRLAESGRPRF